MQHAARAAFRRTGMPPARLRAPWSSGHRADCPRSILAWRCHLAVTVMPAGRRRAGGRARRVLALAEQARTGQVAAGPRRPPAPCAVRGLARLVVRAGRPGRRAGGRAAVRRAAARRDEQAREHVLGQPDQAPSPSRLVAHDGREHVRPRLLIGPPRMAGLPAVPGQPGPVQGQHHSQSCFPLRGAGVPVPPPRGSTTAPAPARLGQALGRLLLGHPGQRHVLLPAVQEAADFVLAVAAVATRSPDR